MSSLLRTRGSRAVAAAIAVVLTTAQAAAQSPAPVPPSVATEARAHFERGVTFYDEGDYPAALVEFKRAYSLDPIWQVLFNVGQSYFQVRDYADALASLRQFVDEGRDQIPPDRLALVHSEIGDLVNRIGYLDVTSNLAGVAISIDQRAVGATPLADPALVSVGVRHVTALYPGRQPIEKEVSVSAGETVEVQVDFADPSPTSAQADDGATPQAADLATPPRSPNRTPAIVSFGVGIAGAAAGTIFGSFALHEKSRLNGECSGKACSVGSQSDIDAVSRDATISTIGFGVAAVGAAVGLIVWFAAKSAPPHPPDTGLRAPYKPTLSFGLVPGTVTGGVSW